MIRKVLRLATVFASGIIMCAATSAAEPPTEVIHAEFGTFDDSNPAELIFEPGDVVPHKVGQRYGWIVEVRTNKRSLSVREEYVLPAAVKSQRATDPLTESLNISTQRRNQVSQRQLVPVEGRIYGEWAIGKNEPAGHRHLQVIIEDKLAASFQFDVK
jgi:hypothetical protein